MEIPSGQLGEKRCVGSNLSVLFVIDQLNNAGGSAGGFIFFRRIAILGCGFKTSSLVASLMPGLLLKTIETVAGDTLISFASSFAEIFIKFQLLFDKISPHAAFVCFYMRMLKFISVFI